MNVLDIMTRKVICVYQTDSLEKAIQAMEKNGSHHVIVVEVDGSLVGIISDRDCKEAYLSPITTFNSRQQAQFANQITVERIMTPSPITITPQVTIQEAANLMLEKHIHALPVFHDGTVIGIVTSTDLLRVVASLTEIVTV